MSKLFRIKYVIFILTFPIIFYSSISFSEIIKKNEFSIVIPDDWIDIPKNIIDFHFESANKILNENVSGFDYGFQSKESKAWFEFPYILIQINNKNRLPLSDWKKLDKYSFNKIDNKIVSSTSIEEFAWEDISKRIWMRMGFNVKNIGEVTCISGIIPTNVGYIQIYVYDLKSSYNINESLYIDYILSVKPDISIDYESSVVDLFPQSIRSINWSFVVEKTFGGIFVSIIVLSYFFIRFFLKKRASGKNKNMTLGADFNDKKQNFDKKNSLDDKNKIFIQNNGALTSNSSKENISFNDQTYNLLKLIKNELVSRYEERYLLVSKIDEQLYEIAILEIETGKFRLGLWAKCFSESEGNEELAKTRYIKVRHDQLVIEKLDQEKKLTKDSTDWLKLPLLLSCPKCQSKFTKEKCFVLDIVENKIKFTKTSIKCDVCNFYFQIPNILDFEIS
jgi:hypothetical protein